MPLKQKIAQLFQETMNLQDQNAKQQKEIELLRQRLVSGAAGNGNNIPVSSSEAILIQAKQVLYSYVLQVVCSLQLSI